MSSNVELIVLTNAMDETSARKSMYFPNGVGVNKYDHGDPYDYGDRHRRIDYPEVNGFIDPDNPDSFLPIYHQV
nr:hypothetical transcript [Hymenolepis microstoma]